MKSNRKPRSSSLKPDDILKRLDILTVIMLARSGLTRKEVAEVLEVSEKTIERMLPFEKLKRKQCE